MIWSCELALLYKKQKESFFPLYSFQIKNISYMDLFFYSEGIVKFP